MNTWDWRWIGLFAAFGAGIAASSAAGDAISLAGKWRFALDRNDTGIKDQWFNRTRP